MNITQKQFSLIAVITLSLTTFTAAEFVHNVDMFGDYNQYLYSTTNAFVLHEHWGGEDGMLIIGHQLIVINGQK